ncbi:MAG: hypothetical protein U0165_19530 [Polyangiaceae bacterium]
MHNRERRSSPAPHPEVDHRSWALDPGGQYPRLDGSSIVAKRVDNAITVIIDRVDRGNLEADRSELLFSGFTAFVLTISPRVSSVPMQGR